MHRSERYASSCLLALAISSSAWKIPSFRCLYSMRFEEEPEREAHPHSLCYRSLRLCLPSASFRWSRFQSVLPTIAKFVSGSRTCTKDKTYSGVSSFKDGQRVIALTLYAVFSCSHWCEDVTRVEAGRPNTELLQTSDRSCKNHKGRFRATVHRLK